MTRIRITEGDSPETVVYADPYGHSMEVPNLTECDEYGCEEEYPITSRWHALATRPSTGELTEVMWACSAHGGMYTEHTERCDHE